jgi:hypothetical protein
MKCNTAATGFRGFADGLGKEGLKLADNKINAEEFKLSASNLFDGLNIESRMGKDKFTI